MLDPCFTFQPRQESSISQRHAHLHTNTIWSNCVLSALGKHTVLQFLPGEMQKPSISTSSTPATLRSTSYRLLDSSLGTILTPDEVQKPPSTSGSRDRRSPSRFVSCNINPLYTHITMYCHELERARWRVVLSFPPLPCTIVPILVNTLSFSNCFGPSPNLSLVVPYP